MSSLDRRISRGVEQAKEAGKDREKINGAIITALQTIPVEKSGGLFAKENIEILGRSLLNKVSEADPGISKGELVDTVLKDAQDYILSMQSDTSFPHRKEMVREAYRTFHSAFLKDLET